MIEGRRLFTILPVMGGPDDTSAHHGLNDHAETLGREGLSLLDRFHSSFGCDSACVDATPSLHGGFRRRDEEH